MAHSMAHSVELFNAIDSNGDGRLSLAELSSYYARTTPGGCTLEQAKAIISEMNSAVGASVAPKQNVSFLRSSGRHELKADFSVGRTEFYCYHILAEAGHAEELVAEITEMRKTFYEYDMDGNGFIDAEELQHAFEKQGHVMTLDEIHELIGLVDEDTNGHIDFLEFMALMKLRDQQAHQ